MGQFRHALRHQARRGGLGPGGRHGGGRGFGTRGGGGRHGGRRRIGGPGAAPVERSAKASPEVEATPAQTAPAKAAAPAPTGAKGRAVSRRSRAKLGGKSSPSSTGRAGLRTSMHRPMGRSGIGIN